MSKQRINTRMLVLDALMIALFVVLSRLLSFEIAGVKITIAALPIIFTAFYLGLTHTVIVSVLAEFITQVLGFGLTPTTVLWMIPGIVRGILICLFIRYLFKKTNNIKSTTHLQYFIMIFISAVVVFILNTFVIIFDGWLYKYLTVVAAIAQLVPRFISMCLSVILYTVATKAVIDKLPDIRK